MQVTGKHLELSPEVRDYLERKLGRLSRHLSNVTEAKVEINRETTKSPQDRYVIQVTLNSHGTLLRGEVRGAELFEVIDNAAKVMDRQIERFKGKLYDKGRIPSPHHPQVVTEPPAPSKVVKSKKFPVKPMSLDEAVEQMELLGHDFFLFLDPNRGQIHLLYRRKDGNYGLIEPELA